MSEYFTLVTLVVRIASVVYIIWDGKRKGLPRSNIVAWSVLVVLFVWLLPIYFLFSRKQNSSTTESLVLPSTERIAIFLPLFILIIDSLLLYKNGDAMGYGVLIIMLTMFLGFLGLLIGIIGSFVSVQGTKNTLFTVSFILSAISLASLVFMSPVFVPMIFSWFK